MSGLIRNRVNAFWKDQTSLFSTPELVNELKPDMWVTYIMLKFSDIIIGCSSVTIYLHEEQMELYWFSGKQCVAKELYTECNMDLIKTNVF
jgi:hypothetical protein